MIKKVGETLAVSLTVTSSGTPVTTDTPYVHIKNMDTGKYYNGLAWQDAPFNFYMTHISNGVYTYRWLLLYDGTFELVATSATYGLTTTVDVSVYSESESTYPWIITEPYVAQFASGKSASSAVVSVQNAAGLYWNGTEFIEAETFNAMTRASADDVVFTYSITFPSVEKYIIFCKNASDFTDSLLFELNVLESEEDISPIIISSSTLLSPDGSDTILIDSESEVPIAGVTVEAYSAATKQISGSAQSQSDGSWSMELKPGRYIFRFFKDGYRSEGFEREVK